MTKKDEAYRLMSKKKYGFDEKKREFEEAKEEYRETLVEETIDNLLKILKDEGNLDERTLKIFIGDLSVRTKQLYDN